VSDLYQQIVAATAEHHADCYAWRNRFYRRERLLAGRCNGCRNVGAVCGRCVGVACQDGVWLHIPTHTLSQTHTLPTLSLTCCLSVCLSVSVSHSRSLSMCVSLCQTHTQTIYIYMYIYIYTHTCVCIYVDIYIYMYVDIDTTDLHACVYIQTHRCST
jgi:hypothetical protein